MKPSCSSQPSQTHAPLRIQVQEMRSPVRENSEVFRQDGQEVSRLRRPGRADDLRPRRAVQGLRLVRHRLRQETFRSRKRQRIRLELERQEGRKTEIGWRVEGRLVQGKFVQRKLFER